MVDIRVTSLWGAEAHCKNNKDKNFAIISTIDGNTGLEFAKGCNHLHVDVYDIDHSMDLELIKDYEDCHGWRFFNKHDAQVIYHFVERNVDQVDYFLIHCHAGVSRSRAVAAALSQHYNNGDPGVHIRRGVPNPTVYSVMCDMLRIKNPVPLPVYSNEVIHEEVNLGEEALKIMTEEIKLEELSEEVLEEYKVAYEKLSKK